MYSTARPREQIVEYQKGVTGANVERAVFSNDSALTESALFVHSGEILPACLGTIDGGLCLGQDWHHIDDHLFAGSKPGRLDFQRQLPVGLNNGFFLDGRHRLLQLFVHPGDGSGPPPSRRSG
jgi:hypothetical protein